MFVSAKFRNNSSRDVAKSWLVVAEIHHPYVFVKFSGRTPKGTVLLEKTPNLNPMKKSTLWLGLACLLMAACSEQKHKLENEETTTTVDTTAIVSSKEEKKEWIPIDSAEGMKAYMEAAKLGDEHKELAKWDGKWTGQITMWETNGGKPYTSNLQATNKMILDGHYQLANYEGPMMGMTFKGTGITGYDNTLKKYIMTWADNMTTGIMKMEGDRDAATKTTTYIGTSKNPANGLDCEMKQVITDVDDNTQKTEMYGPDPKTGEQYKTMEIVMKRSK